MTRKAQSRGTCLYCKQELTKSSMTKHWDKCPGRLQALQTADQNPKPAQKLYHVRVEDAYDKDFWLDLEISGSTNLTEIDHYLRVIWLECCGHLSKFYIGQKYEVEAPMSKQVSDAFSLNTNLVHIYDFGSSSETNIKLLAVREGQPLTNHPITLMARNLMPVALCYFCGQPAQFYCMECIVEHGRSGLLCQHHADEDEHTEFGGVGKLYNSPRMGMCGYDGPAEPPY